MAIISVASTTVVSATSITLTLPTGSTGDYMALFVLVDGDDDPVLSWAPSGWFGVGNSQPLSPDPPMIYAAGRERESGDTSVSFDMQVAQTATMLVVNFFGAGSSQVQSSNHSYFGSSASFSETEPTSWAITTAVVAVAIGTDGIVWSDSGTTFATESGNSGQHLIVRSYLGATATMAGDPDGQMFDLYWHAFPAIVEKRWRIGSVGFR